MRVRFARVALVIASVSLSGMVRGQSTIVGVVRDSTGAPVGGATITIAALGRTTQANETGSFSLTGVTPGMRLISVRRVGFAPFSKLTQVGEGETRMADIVLARTITKLDTVVTREHELWREAPLLREFEENRKMGLGKFYTRDDLEKGRGRSMMSFFETLPGLTIVRATAGSGSWIAATKVRSFSNECVELEDPATTSPRNAKCTMCFPLVYLDFQLLSTSNVVPNINRFRPDDLEAIEVYRSPAQTPARYMTLNSQCGVVVLHQRRPVAKKDKP